MGAEMKISALCLFVPMTSVTTPEGSHSPQARIPFHIIFWSARKDSRRSAFLICVPSKYLVWKRRTPWASGASVPSVRCILCF